MGAGVELHHDHVIRGYPQLGTQDVGPLISVKAKSICSDSFKPLFVARFPTRADAMGDDGRDLNGWIHQGRARQAAIEAF